MTSREGWAPRLKVGSRLEDVPGTAAALTNIYPATLGGSPGTTMCGKPQASLLSQRVVWLSLMLRTLRDDGSIISIYFPFSCMYKSLSKSELSVQDKDSKSSV